MKFDEFNFDQKILKALEIFNFESATQVQEKVIPLILEGKDVIVRSQTGSGKTLAYALPIIEKTSTDVCFPETLIVCPTRELASQVCDEFKKITGRMENIKIIPIFGGVNMDRQIKSLKREPQIVVGTPGRLLDHIARRTLKLHYIKNVVLDEADEMLDLGFKEDIEKILKSTPETKQTLLFSATFPDKIKQIAENFLKNPIKVEIGQENKSLNNITQSYAFVNKIKKVDALLEILETKKDKSILIFCNTKSMVDRLNKILVENSYKAVGIHGDLRQSQRKRVLDDFKNGQAKILIASDVAARGIDVKDIDFVINYDLPKDIEYFLHRIGRTARAGKNGNAITLITTNLQMQELKQIEKETKSVISPLTLVKNLYDSSIPQEIETKGKNRGRSSNRGFSRSSDRGFSRSSDRGFSRSSDRGSDRSSNRHFDRDFDKKASFSKEKSFRPQFSKSNDEKRQNFGDEKQYSRRNDSHKSFRKDFNKSNDDNFGKQKSFSDNQSDKGYKRWDDKKSGNPDRKFFDRKPRDNFGRGFKKDNDQSLTDFKPKRSFFKKDNNKNFENKFENSSSEKREYFKKSNDFKSNDKGDKPKFFKKTSHDFKSNDRGERKSTRDFKSSNNDNKTKKPNFIGKKNFTKKDFTKKDFTKKDFTKK